MSFVQKHSSPVKSRTLNLQNGIKIEELVENAQIGGDLIDEKKQRESDGGKEYTKYKGKGLPIRGLKFTTDGHVIFCNENELVFIDNQLE
jgi:hypothetical protein